MIKAAETDKGSRNSITALKVRVGELQMKVANDEIHLMDLLRRMDCMRLLWWH